MKYKSLAFAALLLGSTDAMASYVAPTNGLLGGGVWDDWILFQTDDGETSPGTGGQSFDAEYFLYRRSGTEIEIGLQTGFDLTDNKVRYGGYNYWGGDLALSFNDDEVDNDYTYEYGVDLGMKTKTYYQNLVDMGSGTGYDTAGLYEVTEWNLDVYAGHTEANPFAIDGGNIIAGGLIDFQTGVGTVDGQTAYFSKVTLDMTTLNYSTSDNIQVFAHWTMSCGNDEIVGDFFTFGGTPVGDPVPEPSTIAMIGLGVFAFAAGQYRRRRQLVVIPA